MDSQKADYDGKLASLETQLRSATAVQRAPEVPTMSNFTRNLLQNKDNEIDKQKQAVATLEDKVWNLENELKLSTGKLAQESQEKDEMSDEINALKQARERAEANVSELKDKLREEVRKSQGLQ